MTININKDVGSKSNITIKGLGDPGPFSLAIIKGSLPTGTTFDQTTGEIKGNFSQKGDFDVTIAGKKKDRIQGSEDFTFKVTDWTLHRTDFKTLVDNNNLSWTTSGTVTKILNDPDIFDGECYEVNGRLTINLPEAIGTRDFEIDYIFKPLNNGSGDANGRILMVGPNNTSGMFYFCRTNDLVPPTILFQYCPNGSTSYTNTFPNVSSPLINNDWNHILLVRKNGVLTYFLNGVREQENSFTLNMDRRELYIGANNSGSEKFYCRVKRLQIRVYDNSHFSKPTLVTDVWRYRIKERSRYLLKSTERNNYLIECNYAGNYTTRVKEGHFLPTGLVLRSNRITGDSDLTNNLTTTIELLINGTVNDEVTINIIDIGKPYRLFELPMIGTKDDVVFGDTQSRQWTRRGDVKIVEDTDNFRDLVATYFDGAGDSLSFTSDDFALGYDDFCYSFWLKPIANGGTVSGRRIINHGANTGTGTFILYNGYDNTGPNITLYLLLNGGWVSTLTPQAIKLNSDVYNHVVLARKGNTWRLLVNGKVVLESYYVFNVTAKGVYIAGSDTNSENYRGNYFDMKLSRYTLDYWAPFIPPVITKWSTQDISIVEQINTDIRRLFKTTWPYEGVTYKVKDTSALPLGLSLAANGTLTGTVTNEGIGETIIECYINGTLNHTAKLTYDIMVSAKSRFLTHSIKASANSADGLKIVKSSNTITTTSVSPTMTEVGPMLSLEFKNPYTAYDSVISIPHAETLLVNKAFCMEAEVYFNGGNSITGRNRSAPTSGQPLFSKSYNGGSGEQGFFIQETNGVYILGFSTGGAHSNPLNVNVPITFDPNKRNHIAFTYDLDKLRFFLNGTLLQAVDWPTGWSNISTQPLEIGQQVVYSYPGWFSAFTGFIDNFNLYQGSAIYTKDFVPEINKANLYPEFPIVEPNKAYKGSLVGVNDHTVSILAGSLPPGLTLSTDGKITGTCTVTNGDYPITLTAVKGTTIENINVNLTIAQYILDLNLNNTITNGTLTDNRGNVFTVNGTPTIQADANFASGRSIYFNGTDSYLSIPADKIFKLGRSDFVIEFDFKATTEPLTNGGSYPGIISQRADGSSQHAFSVWLATGYSTGSNDKIPYDLNNKMSVGISTTTVGSVNVAGSVECSGRGLEKNKVYKVKFVRSGTTIRLYVDDRLMESVAIPADYTLFSSNQNLLIGCLDNTSITNRLFNGYLGSLRIYVPNSADLFSIGIKPENIVSWFDLENSTSGSIVDFNSNNVWTQGVTGVVVNSGEMIFNGSSHLQTTASNDWNLGSSSFTIEYEVYFDSSNNQTYQGLLNKRYGDTIRCSFTTMFNNDSSSENYNKFLFNLNSSGLEYSSLIGEVKTPITKDKYIKISITRAYKKLYLHIDGVLAQQLDVPDNVMFWTTQDPVVLGVLNSGSKTDRYFKGKIRHFRVLKGIALYNTESYTEFKDADKPAGSSTFTPNSLANKPVIYLDSSRATFAGDNTVTNWIDINNLHTFDTGVAARRPIASPDKLNNLSTIRFDGSKALYNNTRSANSIFRRTSYMWGLLVFKKTVIDTGDNDRIIFGARTGSSSWERFGLRSNYSSNWNGMNFRNKFSTGSRVADSGDWIGRTHSTTLDTDWIIALTMVDFVSGKNYMILNGVKEEYPLPLTGMTPDTDSAQYLALGNHPDGNSLSYGFIGDIATFISGNRSLTTDEMDKLVGWAAHNYDLTRLLPNDHPYKTVAPTTADKYDPYYENVYALFPFEEDLLDTTNKIWSVEGNPAISQEKFILGNSSVKFTGTASSVYINQLLRNNDTFTIDFWAYILNDSTGNANSTWHTVVGQSGSGGARDQFLGIEGGTSNTRRVLFTRQTNLANAIDVQSTLTVPDNQWNHIELSWDGIAYRLFVNGVLDKVVNCPIGWTDTGYPFRIGRNFNPVYPQYVSGIQGYLKYFRVTKGIVRHKSSFVPPTTVQEYTPSFSNTSDFRNRALELQPIGYWPLDDNSGTVARDISGNGFHGNIVWGTPTFNAPRLRTGSSKSMGFLDGTGCLQIPIEQAGSLISGLNATGKEFTIIYLEQATKTTAQNIGLCGFKNPFSGDYALRLISGNTLQAKGSGDVTITGLELNKTRFIAWKKDFQQGLFKALVNGVWYNGGAVNPATAGDTFSYPLMLPGSGDQSYNHYPINGYYSDLIIFNKALSDSQIEELYALLDRPPVLPDTEDIVPSNLKMALIGDRVDFEASTNAMPITVNGNVSIIPNGGRDTDSLKFVAGSSLEFNYPDVINIGSKPFAVEFDVNLTTGFGSTNGTEQAPIITNITSANGLSYEWFIGIGNAYAKIYYGIRGSAYSEVTLPWPDGITLTPGVKYTIVIQRDTEGKVCCYLNGKRGTKYRLTPWGSAPVPGSDVDGLYTMNVNFGNIGKPIRVGNFLDSYQLLGELSNLKVYIGQHLYNNSTYKLPEASGRKQFRYYKMNILSGMSSWTELQEMELATTVNGEDVTTPATPVTAIGYYSSSTEMQKPEGLVDNNLTDPDKGSWSHSSTSYPQWVIFDLGQPLRLDEVRIMGRNKSGYYNRGPKQFEIQGSNDNSSWVLLNTLTANDTYKPLTYKRFRLVPIKYRYYKMEIFGAEGGDGYSSIGRVLYGLNNVIVTTSLNTKVTASSFYPTNPATNLIKSDNPQNGDDAWASSTPTLPQWIIHDFGIATEIDQVRMIPQISPHTQRSPKIFRILGSNDGAIWDTIKDFRDVSGWSSGTWKTLSLVDQDKDN